jgi:hypothetical protein
MITFNAWFVYDILHKRHEFVFSSVYDNSDVTVSALYRIKFS